MLRTAAFLMLALTSAAYASESPFEVLGIGGAGGIFTPGASPVDPDFMLCSCDMTGCYRSDDGGRSWKLIHFDQINSAIGCRPYFHPTNVKVVAWKDRISLDKGWTWKPVFKGEAPWGRAGVTHCACAGEGALSLYVGTEGGIWGSSDGGGTWKQVASGRCGGITILPDGTAFAAAGSSLYSWTAGKTAPAAVTTEGLSGGIVALAAGGKDGASTLHAVASGGVHTSNDGGKTWKRLGPGGIVDVVMAQNQREIAYSCDRMNVYVTKDAGGTWTSTFKMGSNVESSWVQSEMRWGYYVIAKGLNVCQGKADMVMMSTQAELFISRDAGAKWAHCINTRVGNAPGGQGGRFRSVGLEVTGSWDYFFDPNEPNRHYCGFSDFGLMRSVDGGQTWSWAARGSPWANTFYDLAFDPYQKGKLYAACSRKHEIITWISNDPRVMPGGVCVSEDFAASWKPMQGLPEVPCTAIEVDRKNSKPGAVVLYAAMWSDGVYKSVDSGKTWTKKPGVGRPGNYHLFQLRIHPKTNDIYVNVSANRIGSRFPTPGGLWKSSDGGDTWKELTADLKLKWLNGFAVHPENPNVIYLTAAACPGAGGAQGGVYITRDGGAKWEHVLKDAQFPGGYVHGLCIELHPDDPNVVYMGGSEGLWASPDGGKTWRLLEDVPFKVCHRVRFNPVDKKRMYITTNGVGVLRGPVLRGIPGERAVALAGGSSGGESSGPSTRPKPRKPAPPPKPSGPTAGEVAAAKAAEAKLRQAVTKGASGGKQESVYIDLMGRSTRAKLLGADGEGIKVRASGMETSIKWGSLSPRRFYGVARKYSDDHGLLADYCRGMGLTEEAEAESSLK